MRGRGKCYVRFNEGKSMAGFFWLLIGYFAFLIMTYHDGSKVWKANERDRKKRKQNAIINNIPVYFYGYEKDNKVYAETKTDRKLFSGTDKSGRKRWYYRTTKTPMNYFEDKRIMESIERNKTMAFVEGRKWCIAEHFWDDSIIEKVTDSKGNLIYYNGIHSFLNDDGLNQKVYIQNMRPYQLHVIVFKEKEEDFYPFTKKQYLIRFGNTQYFNYRTQHCVSDKTFDSAPVFWTKWYAITEDEYVSLTKTDEKVSYSSEIEYQYQYNWYHPINMKDIAFNEGNVEIDWELENCGIKRAFDKDGNFVGG